MKRKRITVFLLALLLILPLGAVGISESASAANKSNARYYYQQLSAEAKQIYDAMYQMYDQGIFKTGRENYDLVENGHVTKEQLAEYDGNYDNLLNTMAAARDAFYADYPDIFYVDFSSLSISVESQGEEYGAYLGIGRRDDYYVEGFESRQQVEDAVKAHEAKVAEIAGGAKSYSSVREQVKYVHDAIMENTSYRGAGECSPGNQGHIHTSYGPLVKKESVCEGYARSFKAVLDSMGITSVLVQGMLQDTDGSKALHMWNYVQIDGKWYGVDVTADDGDGSYCDDYLLADSVTMAKRHFPNGVMSESGFRFTYPQLAGGSSQGEGGEEPPEEDKDQDSDNDGYKVIFNKDGLLVGYRDGTEQEGDTGIFKVSYKGMGYQEAVEKEGVYILSRFYQYMPGTGKDEPGNWGYSDPAPFALPQLKDALILPNANSRIIEFAVTKVAPKGPLYGADLSMEELKENWNFQGTESDFLVSTGQLQNPKGSYVPAPYARKLTPGNTGYLVSGKKYHIVAEFNEALETYDGSKAGYELTVSDENNWTAEKYAKIENFEWDGESRIEFDFTSSGQFTDNYARYNIKVTGLRGKKSQKEPDVFYYDAKKKVSVCAYRDKGIFWNLAGRAALLEPGDISCNNWELGNGKKLVDEVGSLALVASKPELKVKTSSSEEAKEMEAKIKEELGSAPLASATYNVDLLMCNKSIARTGGVRISLGFPKGYGPDEEGVSYKAYHFTKKDGKIVSVEEVSCIVTREGLVITCDSFSPFAVVAVELDEEEANAKKVLLINSDGGEIEGEKIRTLKEGQSQKVKLKAKEGYRISSVYLSGKELAVTDSKSMEIGLAYDGLTYDANIVEVSFAAENGKQEPTSKPEKNDKPESTSGDRESGDGGGTDSHEDSGENNGTTSQETSSGETGGGDGTQGAAPATAAQTQAPATAAQDSVQEQAADAPDPNSDSGSGVAAASNKGAGSGQKTVTEDARTAIEGSGLAEGHEQEEGGEEFQVQAEAEENSRQTEETGIKEITEVNYDHLQQKEDDSFGIILAAIAGAGVIGVAIAVFVKMRR